MGVLARQNLVVGHLGSGCRLVIGVFMGLFCLRSEPVSIVIAQEIPAHVWRHVMGDEGFQQAAGQVCQRCRPLPAEARYLSLVQWVLPVGGDPRVEVGFTSTHPPAIAESASKTTGRLVSTGADLISPALDLVDTAFEVARIEELRARVEALSPATLLGRKNRSAILVLIHLRRGDSPAALKELDQLSQLSALPQPADSLYRSSELVVFERCLEDQACYEVAQPLVERIVGQLRSEKNYSPWSQQVRSRRGLKPHAVPVKPLAEFASQWHPATHLKAQTRGLGVPDAQWHLSPGRVVNAVSHGDDYLYFASPLTGSYQLELDATAFSWMELRPFAAGIWVSPIYTMRDYEVGSLLHAARQLPIEPRLTRTFDSIHLRMAVTPTEVRIFANGRLIHTEPLSGAVDPWLGLRSGFLVEGAATNVHVTGQATIPETIELSAGETLEGWRPYFYEGRDPFLWRKSGEAINGMYDASSASEGQPAFREELLYYHRPMFEDGTIEFEFFSQKPNSTSQTPARSAHVALDRLCLLLRPEGVATHWLTDGRYEQSELPPDNAVIVPEHQKVTGPLPLKDGEWNRAALTVVGDTLRLALNGTLVYERPLESTNQRIFGLFHYADREELYVRNVRWEGDWPKTLPPVTEQTLAVPESDLLVADSAKLTAHYVHDFAKDGLPEERITFIHGTTDTNFRAVEGGIQATITGNGGYLNATIAPAMGLAGDFDIIAEYDQFTSVPTLKGSSQIMLVAFHENVTQDEAGIMRRHKYDSEAENNHLLQCLTVRKTREGEKRDYFVTKPMEERSGRLRLIRRGAKISYLTAEGDSPNYQLRGSRDLTSDPVQMNGIRLVTQIHEKGTTSVLWKKLTVHAEKITGPAAGELDPRITELDRQRDELPVHVVYDMTKEAPSNEVTYRWGDLRPWDQKNQGLSIQAQGTENWTSSGITLLYPLEGDYDFEAEFEVQSLALPSAGKDSGVYLQLEGSDELQTQIGASYSLSSSGSLGITSQVRSLGTGGKPSYRNVGQVAVKGVVAIRAARRGSVVTLLCRPADGPAQIIGRFESHEAPSIGKVLLHTSGSDRLSEMVLKSLRIRAENYRTPVLIPGAIP